MTESRCNEDADGIFEACRNTSCEAGARIARRPWQGSDLPLGVRAVDSRDGWDGGHVRA